MASTYEKLQTLLSELFQLDQADLDFGIYRIMNQKRDEITRFLDKELLPQVKTAFAQYRPADKKVLEIELQKAIQGAQSLGVDPDLVPKVKEIREQMTNSSVDTEALENEVYSHLYSFFRRYYDAGDFISTRRYKEGVYAIPYEGEEVKLHWANADQYYIKTAEYFHDYAFKLPSGRTAHFKITEADVEKDNIKAAEEKDRRFILVAENAIQVENDELIIRFEYRTDSEKRKQESINTETIAIVLASPVSADWASDLNGLAPSVSNPRRTVLEKHLNDYTARNTFDYFIHKNLRGFLHRELDFYIKNEIMRLDDIENENAPRVEQYLSKVKVLRSIAYKIIDFLAQVEDFQKKLWLKKKFVVETNYCITLDRVPEELYPEIAGNDAQREEWVRLFAIDEVRGDLVIPGYSIPLTHEFLKANPHLLLDTRFYSPTFVASLLSNYDDLDAQIDGLLVHSENFQALNLLNARYDKQISCIYIDPPYNTGPSEIIYKNEYRDSSWLSLMSDRLNISLPLLHTDACYSIAIDDFELTHLCEIADQIFTGFDRNMVVVNHHPQGGMSHNISRTHEYMLMMTPVNKDILKGKSKSGEVEYRSFMLSGPGDNKSRKGRPNSFYALLIDDVNNKIVGIEPPPSLGDSYSKSKTAEGYSRRYPISPAGEEKVWCRSYESAVTGLANGEIVLTENGSIKLAVNTEGKRANLMSNWTDSKYNAGPSGTALVAEIMGNREAFSYPKSIYTVRDAVEAMTHHYEQPTVMDYFAGSGTTAHAVINLNREDDGARKYVVVEMGNYFDTVLKPRIQKVVYSNDWAGGKPVSREGVSQCIKYIRLESYEDTLNNLAFKRSETQQLALEQSSAFRENYLLSYMLDTESRQSFLNIKSFSHPFEYKLNIAAGKVGENKLTNIDLVETFNYLIGLRVKTTQALRGFRVVTGLTPESERALIIWRDLDEKSNADLEEFFRKQDYTPRDMEFDLIYVNGDNNLENLRRPDETWKVRLIEDEFMRCMFDTEGL